MRIAVPVVTLGALLLLSACGGGGEEANRFGTLREVVAALDKHTLSNEHRPRVQVGQDDTPGGTHTVRVLKSTLFGANAGLSYNVEPGGYGLQVFVYDSSKTAVDYSTDLATTGSHIHLEGNVALLLTTSTQADLTRLVGDLRD